MIGYIFKFVAEAAATTRDSIKSTAWYGGLVILGGLIGWIIGQTSKLYGIQKLKLEIQQLKTKIENDQKTFAQENQKRLAENEKLSAEIEKIKADEVHAAASVLKQIQDRRIVGDAGQEVCQQQLRQLKAAIVARDKDAIIKHRELFCDHLTLRVITASRDEVELTQLWYKRKPNNYKDFITNLLIPEIKQWAKWLRAINDPILVEFLSTAPLKCSDQTAYPFSKAIDGVPSESRAEVLLELEASIGEWKAAGA